MNEDTDTAAVEAWHRHYAELIRNARRKCDLERGRYADSFQTTWWNEYCYQAKRQSSGSWI